MIATTFGGLSRPYYVRQLFFGLAIFAAISLQSPRPTPVGTWGFMGINVLRYPCARFVYESMVEFVTGNHLFVFNTVLMLVVQFITMLLCFISALFIASLRLAYLYYYRSKNAAEALREGDIARPSPAAALSQPPTARWLWVAKTMRRGRCKPLDQTERISPPSTRMFWPLI